MHTVLVTGGAGFIGGCFVRQLIAAQSTRVINLDKLTYAGNLDSLAAVMENPLHVFIQGDIGDYTLVGRLLEAYQPMAIVNFAAESHVDRSIDSPRRFLDTNVVGTFELLTTARDYWRTLAGEGRERFRFLHVSTDEVYGSLEAPAQFVESSPYAPNSPYAASKAAADHFVRAFYHTYGLPVLTTNCSNNYGPFQFPEKLIPLMILNAVEGKPLPVYGDGQQIRDWLYVEDHCRGLRRVLEAGRPGEAYNIGGYCQRSNLQVVEAICTTVDQLCPKLPHTPCSSLITFVKDRPGHDRRYAIDAGKIRQELAWESQENFASGLVCTVQWYLENSQWVERVTSGTYQRERLGLATIQGRGKAW
jgi:dTDP-glucose 4,6-dehydratase